MLHGGDGAGAYQVALGHGGQALAVILAIGSGFVAVLGVEFEEAVKFHHRAIGAQGVFLVILASGDDVHAGALDVGAFHLAGDGAFPDQFIKGELIGIEIFAGFFGEAEKVGRAHGLMGFLRVLGLGFVNARAAGHVRFTETLLDGVARGGDGFGGHLHAIGTHIGDEARGFAANVHAFIKALGDLHGAG